MAQFLQQPDLISVARSVDQMDWGKRIWSGIILGSASSMIKASQLSILLLRSMLKHTVVFRVFIGCHPVIFVVDH